MQIQYELTFQDFLAAQKLHARRSLFRFLCLIVCLYIWPLLGLAGLALSFTIIKRPLNPTFDDTVIFGGSVVLILIPIFILWQWRTFYTRTRVDSGDITFDFEPELIRTKTKHSKGEVEWALIKRMAENKKLFLLYIAQAKFFIIPKRVCSAGQIEELRALFQAKITSLQKNRV